MARKVGGRLAYKPDGLKDMNELEENCDPRVVGDAEVFDNREIVKDADGRNIKKYIAE